MRFYAYIYRDPSRLDVSGAPEAIYVGKGCGSRFAYHLSRVDKHPLTARLAKMRAAGVEPVIEVLPMMTEEQAFEVEDELIKKHGLKVNGNGTLLNLTEGVPSGRALAGEVKARISKALMGRTMEPEHKEKIKHAMQGNVNCVGRKYSQETIDRMSASQRARIAARKQSKEQTNGI